MANRNYDVLVIGGGASGIAAAITAKKENPAISIAILEKGDKLGRKLAITGNGRCNISNVNALCADEVWEFLKDGCGILLRRDEVGRIYPYSEDAGQVAEYLGELAESLGVEILLNHEVKKVEACPGGGFLLLVNGPACGRQGEQNDGTKKLKAEYVVLATGGKSYPKTGSTGDGYVIARSLGHEVSPLRPALVPVCVEPYKLKAVEDGRKTNNQKVCGFDMKELAGVRAKAHVHLIEAGKDMGYTRGEVQFREDSISGICVLDLSSGILPHGSLGREGYADYELSLDLMPDMDEHELEKYFEKNGAGMHALKPLVKDKLARVLLAQARCTDGKKKQDANGEVLANSGQSTVNDQAAELAKIMKDFRLQVTGLKGWKEAQVTAGGVSTQDVNLGSLESKIVPGLYITGEVLDFARDCGGFNLAFAWMTGSRAGRAIAKEGKDV